MRVIGIVQMRMGSSRLPGKMLKPLAVTDAVGLSLGRMGRAARLTELVAATTDNPIDNPLAERCRDLGVPVHRGSENDVLDRFYRAAKERGAEAVVRLTGDCPFHDPAVIDRAVDAFLSGPNDLAYLSNVHPPTYPDGLDVEVMTIAALETAWREAEKISDREHVTPFIWGRPDRFSRLNLANDQDLSHLRWTLDEQRDLDFMEAVLAEIKADPLEFTMADVLAALRRRPGLEKINGQINRNEGYVD